MNGKGQKARPVLGIVRPWREYRLTEDSGTTPFPSTMLTLSGYVMLRVSGGGRVSCARTVHPPSQSSPVKGEEVCKGLPARERRRGVRGFAGCGLGFFTTFRMTGGGWIPVLDTGMTMRMSGRTPLISFDRLGMSGGGSVRAVHPHLNLPPSRGKRFAKVSLRGNDGWC